jgi:SAM-dependent methyltransferase
MLQRFVGGLAQALGRKFVASQLGEVNHGQIRESRDTLNEFHWEPASGGVHLVGEFAGQSAAALNAGESIVTPAVAVHSEHRIHVTVAANAQGGPGRSLDIEYSLIEAGADTWRLLAAFHVVPSDQPRRIEISLAALAGRTCLFRIVRPRRESAACLVSGFSICSPQRLGRLNALSGYENRMRNEVRNFSGAAYTHAMYGERSQGSGGEGKVNAAVSPKPDPDAREIELLMAKAHERLALMEPVPGEAAFNYALRALGALLPMEPPDFFQRARKLSEQKPLRILSICAGAARVEEQILDHCSGEVELTLLDASPDLIRRAADRLSNARPGRRVECLIGDVNAGLPGEGRFDVIICVSALHHVADLERVLGQINQRLEDDGQFWSVGEQIGRNGNRLWPDAYEAANRAFAQLPERLRRNAHTRQVDALVSDRDFSIGCFEGIRSEELETLLEAHFIPVQVYKRNAFLWRLVDATYSDNFDLSNQEDLEHLRRLVRAEAVHWACGGRSTELHGVYRRKFLQ